MAWVLKSDEAEKAGEPERVTYTFGTTPVELIRQRLPEAYSITPSASDRSNLEQTVEAAELDIEVSDSMSLTSDQMVALLEGLAQSEDEDWAMSVRTSILETLNIEEI